MTSRIALLLAFAVVAAASKRFRVRQLDPDLDAPDSANSGGDYMDRYIAASKHKAHDSWWSTPSEHQHTSADAAVRGSKMDDVVADMNRRSSTWHDAVDSSVSTWHNDMDSAIRASTTSADAAVRGSKMDDVVADMNRRSSTWHDAVDSSVSTWHNDMDSSAPKVVGRRQPIELDSPMEGISRSSAQAPPPHGAVVDIKLDSELQTSTKKEGMAKKGLRFIQARARSAPNVET
eukprot:CAMPEP_0172778210 /NCGR_PEP_ID=MMETSP1074-20121228/201793_1 /TAXON_ID=2916 /ORGANISM="Ceratium fusus, Strain PA161109" /LENGTH=232 /DNA_ID=CAMNT_0013615141 /DNA_START=43 /DNA_END=739 /DNA_ORIENTATION=+